MDKNTDEFTIEDILIDDAQVVMVHRCESTGTELMGDVTQVK